MSPGQWWKFDITPLPCLPDALWSLTPPPKVYKALDWSWRQLGCRQELFHPRHPCVKRIKSFWSTRMMIFHPFFSPTVNRTEVRSKRCIMLLWPGLGCWHLSHRRGPEVTGCQSWMSPAPSHPIIDPGTFRLNTFLWEFKVANLTFLNRRVSRVSQCVISVESLTQYFFT